MTLNLSGEYSRMCWIHWSTFHRKIATPRPANSPKMTAAFNGICKFGRNFSPKKKKELRRTTNQIEAMIPPPARAPEDGTGKKKKLTRTAVAGRDGAGNMIRRLLLNVAAGNAFSITKRIVFTSSFISFNQQNVTEDKNSPSPPGGT